MQFCNPSIQEVKGSLDYTVKLREREREVGWGEEEEEEEEVVVIVVVFG